jgi:hypothetical protein
LRRNFAQFVFGLFDQPIADFRNALQVAFALFGLFFDLELLDFFFECTRSSNQLFLLFPTRFERI